MGNIIILIPRTGGFPGGASGKESACHCRKCKRLGFNPWVGKIPWSGKWQPTLVFLPRKCNEQRSLAGYRSHVAKKSQMRLNTQKHNAPFQFISCSGFPNGSAVNNLLANAGDMGLIPGSGRSPNGSAVNNLLANAGDMGLIPGSGRSPGEGNGNPLQYSCLGNPMDRGAWQVTVRGVAKSQARLCIWAHVHWRWRQLLWNGPPRCFW